MIYVYGLPGCPMCVQVKSKLSQLNVPFDYVTDEQVMTCKGITHVPVVELEDGSMLTGKAILDYLKQLEESIQNG